MIKWLKELLKKLFNKPKLLSSSGVKIIKQKQTVKKCQLFATVGLQTYKWNEPFIMYEDKPFTDLLTLRRLEWTLVVLPSGKEAIPYHRIDKIETKIWEEVIEVDIQIPANAVYRKLTADVGVWEY